MATKINVRELENAIDSIEGLMEAARKHLSCCVAAHGLVMGAWPKDGSYAFDPFEDEEVKDFGFNASEVAAHLRLIRSTVDDLRKFTAPEAPSEPTHDEILRAMGGPVSPPVEEMTTSEILADCKRMTDQLVAAVTEKPGRKRGRPRGRRAQLRAANAAMAATVDAAAEE